MTLPKSTEERIAREAEERAKEFDECCYSSAQRKEFIAGAIKEAERAEKLRARLERLRTCWGNIPPLDCSADGFHERLYEDRNRRVLAFFEALADDAEMEKP